MPFAKQTVAAGRGGRGEREDRVVSGKSTRTRRGKKRSKKKSDFRSRNREDLARGSTLGMGDDVVDEDFAKSMTTDAEGGATNEEEGGEGKNLPSLFV